MDRLYPFASAERLLESIRTSVFALDDRGRVVRVNGPGCRLLEREPAELAGREWLSLLPVPAHEPIRRLLGRLYAGDADVIDVEGDVLRGDGTVRSVSWRYTPVRGPDGRTSGVVVSGDDVSERRQAESALAQFQYALDQAAIVAITDRRGTIRYANDEFCRISGYSREELLGRTHRIVNSKHHPGAFFRDMWSTIEAGRVWRGEILNRAKDGTPYWVDTTIVPLLDADGRPESYLAIRNDVTERKRVEAELAKQNALAQVGQMAAVVAHEVRNPLAGIAGAVEIIGRRLPENSSEREVMGGILERIDDLNRKIEDLLAYSRPKPPRLQPVAVAEMVDELVAFLDGDASLEGVRMESTVEPATLDADPTLLRELLTNVILNAGQAMEGRGEIVLRGERVAGGYRLQIIDDGPGMPEEVRARVLEPFYSTRHNGTGLGLAIADRVASAHGGRLEVASTAGEGTRVTLTLPLKARRPD